MKTNYKYTILFLASVAVIIAVIIGFSIYAQNLLRKDTTYLVGLIEELQDDMKSGKWDNANECLKKIDSNWSDVNTTWAVLIDHQEIENIDSTLSRLKMLVEYEEMPMALSEAEVLRNYIEHIPDKEKLTLENVF